MEQLNKCLTNYIIRCISYILFLNETNTIVQINDPKIIGFFVAIVIGYISKNIILTIIAGLISYWIVIFLF